MLSFSILAAIWTVFVAFLFISVLLMMFSAIVDLFRDEELSGWGKAGWLLLLVVLPLLGLLIYVIVRGEGMTKRSIAQQKAAKDEFDAYVRETAGSGGGGGAASELEKASKLRDEGKISDEEFAALKSRILA
ncbi:MAG: SHOCT domain-containing protein [Actinomycetota bacterium]